MPSITQFGGIVPRAAWHMLGENEATVAHDVKLRNGKLQAWRERRAVGMGHTDAVTLYYKGCCGLTWDTCVSVAPYVTDYDRLFITGHSDRPETFTLSECEPTYYWLGVPAPKTALTCSGTVTTGRDCHARSYYYTYVNRFGEESAPSPVSNVITVKDGSAVTLTGIAVPPEGYGIEEVWIYRAATAYRDAHVKEQQPATVYLKVVELDAGVTSYTESVKDKALGPANNTEEVRMPPSDLRWINYIRGTGVLVGVTANMVHFSQPFQPYNWPAANDLTLPYNIIHMVSVGTTVFISTDGYPFVIDGSNGCEARQCRAVTDVDIPLPDIACGYPHSAIGTPFGMVYASKDGLVLVTPNGQFQILTASWFGTDEWVKLRPDTVRLAYWRGYLVCVTDMISFMLEIDGDTYHDMKLGTLTTISDKPVDMVTSDSGELLMLDEDALIYQWDAGTAYRPYVWCSRELLINGASSPTTAKVHGVNVTFRLLTPVDGLYYERRVVDREPFRLGRLGRHLRYRIELEGTGDVEYAHVGFSELTINEGR